VDETAGPPFLVDDGSGQPALVDPAGATLELNVQSMAHTGTFKDAPAHLEQFLQARGKTSEGLFFNKDMKFWEQALVPGGNLTAIGPARRELPAAQLVLRRGEGPAGELLLTDVTREGLIARGQRGFGPAYALLGIGALLDVVGLVVLLVAKAP
jgi:FAD/FMN-containing dehydrogenase